MLTLALCLALLTPTLNQQTQGVTLTFPAARVPVVLDAIGKQIGRKLAADPAMSREVVALRVVAAPADPLLAHLAEAVGGEWQSRNGIKTLVVSVAATQRDEIERQAKRTKAILALIASLTPKKPPMSLDEETVIRVAEKLRGWIANPPKRDEVTADDTLSSFEEPKTTLLHSLVRMLPPAAYVGAQDNERIVLSDSPNGLQWPFPAAAAEAIDRFRHDQGSVDHYLLPLMREAIAQFDSSDDSDASKLVPLPEEYKVELAIQFDSWELDGAPNYLLNIVDAAGRILATESIEANMQANDGSEDKPAPEPQAGSSPMVTPTDDEREFPKLFNFSAATLAAKPKLLAKWRSRLLDPLKYDPLTTLGSPIVRAAELRGADLVADLDESFVGVQALVGTSDPPTGFTASALERHVAISARASDYPGWIILRPLNFSDSRKWRVDRLAAKRLLERIVESNGLTIDDASEYSLSSDSPILLEGWDAAYAHDLESEDGRNGVHSGAIDTNALRIYGSLGPDLRDRLRSGRLSAAALPASAQAILFRDFYWNNEGSQEADHPFEPTDVLPNGLPPNAPVRLRDEVTELTVVPVRRIGQGIVGTSGPRSAKQLGMALAGPQAPQWASVTGFRTARLHHFDILAQYGPEYRGVWSLRELFYPPDPIVTYSDLPADFRAQVDAAKAQRRQAILEENDGKVSPPP